MKKQFLLLLLMLSGLTAVAAPVTREAAQQLASDFVAKHHPRDSRRNIKAVSSRMALKPASNEAYYHVFNIGNDKGFVVVSGDDRTEAIIGYTDKGSFDDTQLPDNLKAWLSAYVEQMKWLEAHPDFANQAEASRAPRRALTKSAIAPLIQTLWNQHEPFNNSCPDFFTFGKALTGCVATAMSQLMYYHKWPAKLAKTIDSYTCETNWVGYGQITVDGISEGLVFDWDNMLPDYSKVTATASQKEAVAKLVAVCGAAVHMDYSNQGSSAYDNEVVPALRDYFDYSALARLVYRSDYLYDEWTDLIYSELAEARPVYYSGQSSGGGHAFLVDGYDGEGYFHVNWGWGGLYNGYFLLSVLKPGGTDGAGASKSSDGYSFDQVAVIGIKKDEGELPVSQEDAAPMDMEVINMGINEGTAWIESSYYSSYPEKATIDFGIAYIADDGSLVPIQASRFMDLERGWGNDVKFDVAGLPDGTYRIVPVSRLEGAEKWCAAKNYETEYVRCVISGGKAIVCEYVTPVSELKATDIVAPKKIYANGVAEIEARITNTGDAEYYGLLYLFASQTGEKGAYVAKGGVTVLAGQAIETSFEFTPAAAGKYNLWVATDEEGAHVIGTGSITVLEALQKTDDIELVYEPTINTLSDDGKKIVGKQATVTWTVTNPSNKLYEGQLYFYIYTWQPGGGASIRYSYKKYTIYPEETLTVTNTYDVANGTTYSFDFAYTRAGERVNPKELFNTRYEAVSGMSYYLADGTKVAVDAEATVAVPAEATAVDLRNNSAISQLSGGNPNTLYFLDEGAVAPAGCGANIVRKGVAESIVVTDGYDFVTPELFEAKDIVYKRTFDQGLSTDNKGWSTIALPFDVSEINVVSGGAARPIDWFHTDEEQDKDFWLMKLDRDENENLFFVEADAFKALTPYLIAVPGAGHESAANLAGKTLEFKGANALIHPEFTAVSSSEHFRMKGLNAATSLSAVYMLDAAGATFVKGDASQKAFRAYIISEDEASTFEVLNIKLKEEEPIYDGISTLDVSRQGQTYYTIDGRRVGTPTQRGLYIKGGKKVVKMK